MNLIADTIRGYRSLNGLSQAALGAQLGLAQSQIGALEKGIDFPSLPTLQSLARFFKFKPIEIGQFVMSAPLEPRANANTKKKARKRSEK